MVALEGPSLVPARQDAVIKLLDGNQRMTVTLGYTLDDGHVLVYSWRLAAPKCPSCGRDLARDPFTGVVR